MSHCTVLSVGSFFVQERAFRNVRVPFSSLLSGRALGCASEFSHFIIEFKTWIVCGAQSRPRAFFPLLRRACAPTSLRLTLSRTAHRNKSRTQQQQHQEKHQRQRRHDMHPSNQLSSSGSRSSCNFWSLSVFTPRLRSRISSERFLSQFLGAG